MKNIALLIIILSVAINAFAQDEKSKITNLNQQTVAFYKSGKLDEAEKTAQKSVDLSEKFYGLDSTETAVAYINLGSLQREKAKYGDSVKNIQNALNIFLKQQNYPAIKIVELYQSLAFSQLLNSNKTEAEKNYVTAMNLSENKFGNGSKELFTPTLSVANFYARNGNFEKSDEYYLKSYRLAKKNFGSESAEVKQVADSRVCLNKDKENKAFDAEYDEIFEIDESLKPENVVNGKARKLITPAYPREAKDKGLSGTTKVRVTIDEQGNVVEAHSICGGGVLGEVSEQSALASKFSPTLVNGKAIRVTGIIVYNFVRR